MHVLVVVLLLMAAQVARADQLPPVAEVQYDGQTITWQAVEGAIGYNIHREFLYVDTVIGATEYVPDRVGEYRIAAFDGNGNFSPLQVIDKDVVTTSNVVIVESVSAGLASPQNVVGLVYSSSAGEIFWDRVISRSLEYRITMNGVEVDRTTGSSFYIDTLLPNALNTISVAARSAAGLESEAVTLLFDTRVDEFPVAASRADTTTPIDSVASPQNARIQKYSSTTAELFWDRAPPSEEISITEIYRDNELLGTSPGNSFYDDTRSVDTRHAYGLVAVDANGARSATTFVDADTFDGSDETVVQTVLAGISEVATGNPHVVWFPTFQSLAEGNIPDSLAAMSTENIDKDGVQVTRSVYDCGGDTSLTIESSRQELADHQLTFKECNINRIYFDGSVSISGKVADGYTVNYDEVVVSFDDFDNIFNGQVSVTNALVPGFQSLDYNSFEYYIFSYVYDEDAFDTSVTLDQTVTYDVSSESPTSFTTSFMASAPWTQGRSLTVTTKETFTGADLGNGNYTVGKLSAEASNGEKLLFTADTGNDSTWRAELFTADSTGEVSGDWNDLVHLPCIVITDGLNECQ